MGMSLGEARKRVTKEGGLGCLQELETYQAMVYTNLSDGSMKTVRKSDPTFPKPRKRGIRKNLWNKAELDQWMKQEI